MPRAFLFALGLLLCLESAGSGQYNSTDEKVSRLLVLGRIEDAFVELLSKPDGEAEAVRLSKTDPAHFLRVLAGADSISLPRRKLLEGELHLALGHRETALACFRAVAKRMGRFASDTWKIGFTPVDFYFSDLPPSSARGYGSGRGSLSQFEAAVGGFDDNWLLRRFIALESWSDAAQELERMAGVHRRRGQPFVARVDERGEGAKTDRVVQTLTVSGEELSFTLFHAHFWKERGQQARALELLREQLFRLDFPRNPFRIGPPLPQGEPLPYPRRPGWRLAGEGPADGTNLVQLFAEAFIETVWQQHERAGQTDELIRQVERRVSRRAASPRLLAILFLLRGQKDRALAVELAHIDATCKEADDALSLRAEVHQRHGKWPVARALWENRLARPAPGQAIDALLSLYKHDGPRELFLDLLLRQFDLEPRRLADRAILDRVAGEFHDAGQIGRFVEWVQEYRSRSRGMARGFLSWLLCDRETACRELLDACRAGHLHPLSEQWPEPFHDLFAGRHAELLDRPVNSRERAQRQNLLIQQEPLPESIERRLLEAELARITEDMQEPGADALVETFPLAYRLLRLYEKQGQSDELARLGRQLLLDRPPFPRSLLVQQLDTRTPRESPEGEFVLPCLLLWLSHASQASDLAAFADLAGRVQNVGFKNQVARRLHSARAIPARPGSDKRPPTGRFQIETIGVPDHVRLLCRRDDVRALSADGKWIGTSWGLVCYQPSRDGLAVVQVPLGSAVDCLAQTPFGLFAGTSSGIFHVADAAGARPQATRLRLKSQASEQLLAARCLLWWRERLWISGQEGIWSLDPRTNQIRHAGTADGTPGLFVAAGKLWSSRGVLDPQREVFDTLLPEHVEIVAVTRDEIWLLGPGEFHVDALSILEPLTGSIRPVPLEAFPEQERHERPRLAVRAEDGERVWLQLDDHLLEYTRRTGKLRRVVARLDGFDQVTPGPVFWRDGKPVTGARAARGIPARWLDDPAACRLSSGERLLIGLPARGRTGGLFGIDTDRGTWRDRGCAQDALPGKCVLKLVFDEELRRLYVCGTGGLTILSSADHEVLEHLGAEDGLPENAVSDVRRQGRCLYIRCASASGLARYDLDTGLLQRFMESENRQEFVGLASFPLPLDDRGRIVDPEDSAPSEGKPLPFLGGSRAIDVTHQGKRYLAGPHGLVILGRPTPVPDEWLQTRDVQRVRTADQRWQEERTVIQGIRTPADLERHLRQANPYLRLSALENLNIARSELPGYLPVLALAQGDTFLLVRRAVCSLLAQKGGAEVKPYLEKCLEDVDEVVRGQAGVALLRLGQRPASKHANAMLTWLQGTEPGTDALAVVAPCLGSQDLVRMMFPWPELTSTEAETRLKHLGSVLRRHPEAALLLLEEAGVEDSGTHLPPRLARLFAIAGKAVLPFVWRGLAQPNPDIRMRAARACLAVGDRSSLPRLRLVPRPRSANELLALAETLAGLGGREVLDDLFDLHLLAEKQVWISDDESGILTERVARAWHDTATLLDPGAWREPVDEEILGRTIVLLRSAADETVMRTFLIQQLRGQDIDTRLGAAVLLAEMGSP